MLKTAAVVQSDGSSLQISDTHPHAAEMKDQAASTEGSIPLDASASAVLSALPE